MINIKTSIMHPYLSTKTTRILMSRESLDMSKVYIMNVMHGLKRRAATMAVPLKRRVMKGLKER